MRVFVNGDAEAFAAEHEPDDAEFPVLEAIYLGMRMVVKVQQGTGGDEGFAASIPCGEKEWDVGDLLSQDVDRTVNPDNLLVGVGKDGAGAVEVVAAEPLLRGERAFERGSVGAWAAGDVETEEFHGCGVTKLQR